MYVIYTLVRHILSGYARRLGARTSRMPIPPCLPLYVVLFTFSVDSRKVLAYRAFFIGAAVILISIGESGYWDGENLFATNLFIMKFV